MVISIVKTNKIIPKHQRINSLNNIFPCSTAMGLVFAVIFIAVHPKANNVPLGRI